VVEFGEGLVKKVFLLDLIDLFDLHHLPLSLLSEILKFHVLCFQVLLQFQIVLVVLVSIEFFIFLSLLFNFSIIGVLQGHDIPHTQVFLVVELRMMMIYGF
jgi:hypothetical protein